MAKRIPWDKYETAVLIDACIQVMNNKTDRSTAIETVSAKLRKRAVNLRIVIDDIYRNENRINIQMSVMTSMLQDEEPSFYNVSKMFYKMVELYKYKYSSFCAILTEANLQINGTSHKKADSDGIFN